VADDSRDEHTIDDLIAALERAPEGGDDLDRMIAFQLGLPVGESDQMIKLLLFEGYEWDVISELVQSENPRFSTVLDARIPGENIVLAMRSNKRNQWAAIHRAAGGTDFMAWAATEALARRAAALRGLRAVSTFEPRPAGEAMPAPRAAPAGEGAPARDDSASPSDGQAAAPDDAAPDDQDLPAAATGLGDRAEAGEWKILF
jgi:hypothetical protein